MIRYTIRCGTPTGQTETRSVDGYFAALDAAKEMAARNKHCAIIYIMGQDGLKIKNTIAPDGRRIKNG